MTRTLREWRRIKRRHAELHKQVQAGTFEMKNKPKNEETYFEVKIKGHPIFVYRRKRQRA